MKRRTLIRISCCMMMTMLLIGCGKQETDDHKSVKDETASSVEEQVEESGEDEASEETAEIFDDDKVISFTDAKMAEDVREVIGVPEGNITYGMVKDIREFQGKHSYSDITALKYFTGLTDLTINTENEDLKALAGLENLETLEIVSDGLTDVSALGKLPNLESLSLINCSKLSDLKGLDKSQSLSALNISTCSGLSMEDIDSIHDLKELSLSYADGLTDISELKDLNKIENLRITNCNNLSAADCNGLFPELTWFGIQSCNSLTDLSMDDHQNIEKIIVSECGSLNRVSLVGLKGLGELEIWRCADLALIEGLENLNDLKKISINECDKLTSLDKLNTLSDLEELNIHSCDGLTMLDLSGMQSLSVVNVHQCAGLEGFIGLDGLQNLSHLYIEDCDGILDIRNIGDLSNNTSLGADESGGVTAVKLSITGCDNLNGGNVSSLEGYMEAYQEVLAQEKQYIDESDSTGETIAMVLVLKSAPIKGEDWNNAQKIASASKGEAFPYVQTISNDYEKWYEITYAGEQAFFNASTGAVELIYCSTEEYNYYREYMRELYGGYLY